MDTHRPEPDNGPKRPVTKPPGVPLPRVTQCTLSIRLMWPFVRVIGADPRGMEHLASLGIGPEEFANPATRIPHTLSQQLLRETIERIGDPTLGLKAGEQIDSGDFDVLEHAARCSATLGEATQCMARYYRLMSDAAEITLVEEGPHVAWRYRVTDGVPQEPASNDFAVAAAMSFSRRNSTDYRPPIEVHLAHQKPSYASEYERVFDCPVRFGTVYNTIVMDRARLSAPMLRANPSMSHAFELQLRQLLDKLRQSEGVAGRVREEVASQLSGRGVSMHATAKSLAMSVATLRRRLEAEGITFARIVDDLRKGLAEQYLTNPGLTITEVAFLLGFSNVTAFHRAFKRWTGASPATYRARSNRA